MSVGSGIKVKFPQGGSASFDFNSRGGGIEHAHAYVAGIQVSWAWAWAWGVRGVCFGVEAQSG
jgi:hypothetical protein